MMRRSGVLLIVLGLLLAILSGVGVFSVLRKQTAPPPPPTPTVKVVVATQNIPERTMVQASMVTVKDWPEDIVPVGAQSRTQDVVGQVTSSPIVVGEPILSSKFSTEQATIGLAPTLPPGLVAFELALSSVGSVGGAIREGDTVDVLVSMEYSEYDDQGDESKPMQVAFYTIQDVPVIAISGQESASSPSGVGLSPAASSAPSSPSAGMLLTVLVTPQDALLLKYAREKGVIDLALRSPQFHDQVVTDPVYLDYITRRFDLPKPLIVKKQQASSAGEGQ
jgi:pilus assembly protein CpaB